VDWNKLKAEVVAALTVVFMIQNSKLHWGVDPAGVAAIVGLMGTLIVMYAMSHTAQVKAASAMEVKAMPDPASAPASDAGTTVAKVLMMILLLGGLTMGAGCHGLAAKTAKDIDTASSQILPEYVSYVDADPKLDAPAKQRRKDQVSALQDVIKNAQK
jgi:hypothetical protein